MRMGNDQSDIRSGTAFIWILLGYLFLGKATSHLGTIDWVYLVEATSLVQDGL